MSEPELTTKIKKGKGIYLLPNLFTTSSLFAGFYSIVAAMNGAFDNAAIAIFIAMIFDTLDGRVARMTNTESAFGAEYDSLSDMVPFGVAPGLIIYSWSLTNLGKIGWLAAFFYTAAVALRLARFNTQIASQDKSYFQGLPCPAAAAVVVGMVWVGFDYGWYGKGVSVIMALITVAIASLMVSNCRYYSFKQIDLRGKVPFMAVLAIVLVFVAISIDPPQMLLAAFGLYALSGVLLTTWAWHKAYKKRCKKPNHS